MNPRPLLNIDLAELENEPEALFECADIANLACGGHAGDDDTIARALSLCDAHDTRIGAHPSYPDREGFGRRSMAMPDSALRKALCDQLSWLDRHCRARGVMVKTVKPHGALYHDAERDPRIAEALILVVRDVFGSDIKVIGGPHVCHSARLGGLSFMREQFADRGVREDGSLVPRGEPGALIAEPSRAAERARDLWRAGACDTLCLHGDTPRADAIARAVRHALDTPIETP